MEDLPQMIEQGAYANGEYVAQHVEQDELPEEELLHGGVAESRIQPNGVDIGIEKIESVIGMAVFDDGEYEKPAREERDTIESSGSDCYCLTGGPYIVTYDVTVSIPEGYVGRMYPRSRLMRSGIHLTSALWDQGYTGQGEGLLKIPDEVNAVIAEDELIAQFCLIEADQVESQYDGSHQLEGMEA